MSIDMDINEMFNEKNRDIFLNKLLMDLDNNTDTFKMTTRNIVKIEIAKLGSSIKKIYDKYHIEYKEEKIKEIFKENQEKLLEDLSLLIEEKKQKNGSFISENRDNKINKIYLKDYAKKIEENDNLFDESLKLTISEHIESSLYSSLLRVYSCTSEQMHQDLLYAINFDCCNKMITRILSESKQRSGNLKNMSNEAYDKYLLLEKNSITIKKGPSVKRSSKIKMKQDK